MFACKRQNNLQNLYFQHSGHFTTGDHIAIDCIEDLQENHYRVPCGAFYVRGPDRGYSTNTILLGADDTGVVLLRHWPIQRALSDV